MFDDFSHVYLIGGVLSWDIWLWLQALRCEWGVKWDMVREYVEKWTWPGHIAKKSKPSDAWKKTREVSCLEADKLKFGASEILTVYPVLRCLSETVAPPRVASKEREAVQAGFKVLDAWH